MNKKLSLLEQFVAALLVGRAEPQRDWWEEDCITPEDVNEAQMRAAVRKALAVVRNHEKGAN